MTTKYRIEPANGFAVCASTHVVKCKGRIVYRGTEDECHDWAQGAVQADRDFAVEGR